MVSGFLKQAKPSDVVPKAIIAPHAGYIYSGPIAASAYAQIAPARERIKRLAFRMKHIHDEDNPVCLRK